MWEGEIDLAADLEQDLWSRVNRKLTARIPQPKQSRNLKAITPVLDPMKLLPERSPIETAAKAFILESVHAGFVL